MAALWVCEKYAVASELARILFGGIASHVPPLIVTRQATRLVYTNGHALEPAAPEVYDPAYKSWDHQDVATLVQNGFRLVAGEGKSAIVSVIEKELQAASEVVVATDAGREGEMIAWEIIEHAGTRAPVRRFWTSALTENALRKAAAELLPAERKLPLYHAGRARSRADWIEGLSYTRYFTRHHTPPKAKPLSVGRVQSAVTALVEDRCREIRDFAPRAYFEVKAVADTPHGPLQLSHRPPPDQRLEDRSEAEAIANRILNQAARLSVQTVPKTLKPVDFMNTSGAQKRAFTAWNWTPERTLSLLQKLYEAKHLTYPRTECIYLSSDHAPQMPGLLRTLSALPDIAAIARSHPAWIEAPVIRAASYDDAKLTDHHAIIPTDNVPDLARLDPDEAKLYQLIVRHTVANLLPDYRYDSTTVTAELDGKPFSARGQVTREPGWRVLISEVQADEGVKKARKRKAAATDAPDDEEELTQLPPLQDGDQATARRAEAIARQTRPPAYFTQASLLDAMVNIDLYIDDPHGKAVLGGPSADRKRGIGTGATRAHIIKTLFEREYVTEQGTAIHTTARGSAFISLARRLVPWMTDPLHSAEQEAALQEIEAGTMGDATYVSGVIDRTRRTLSTLQEKGDTTRIDDGGTDPAQERRRSAPSGRRGRYRSPLPDRTQPTAPPTPDATGRFYYRVPFERKDQAKTLGMRFDGERKQWFAPSPEIATAANAIFPASR